MKRHTSYVSRQALARGMRFLLPLIVIGLLILLAWPQTYPPKGMCAMSPYPTMDDVYAFERDGWMGVDPEGSYFPVWVEEPPTDTSLAEVFIQGDTPARLDLQALPDGARVVSATYRPLRASLIVETPRAFQARWLGLYYPGWRVWVDGEPVAVLPEAGSGLLTFPVPLGRHEVRVRFGTTPLRATGSVIACLGLGAFVVVWVLARRRSWLIRGQSRKARSFFDPSHRPASGTALWVMAGLAVGMLLLKVLVVDRGRMPLHRMIYIRHDRLTAGALPEVDVPLHQPFAGGLTLLGYTLPETPLSGDGELQVDLLWLARARPPAEYRTSVLLVGQDGRRWSPDGTLRPRGYEPTPPTTMWQPGQYAYDPHIVQPLAGAPPGEYDVVVALFDKHTLTPLSVLDPEGNPWGPDLTLGAVTVTRPRQPLGLSDFALSGLPEPDSNSARPGSLDPGLSGQCDPLRLWTMTADRDVAAPGEILGLRWVWEALADPTETLSVTLTLAHPVSGTMRTWKLSPVAAWWPTDRWQAGDRWVGRPVVRLPGGLASGVYTLTASLDPEDCESLGRVTLEVVAPERHWEVPPDLTPLNVVFGDPGSASDKIRLAGYAVETDGDVARPDVTRVRLAWQALVEMETAYRVFVHLRDHDGSSIVAQSDGEPVSWTRPTTGWAVGEVVTEVREIPLPQDLSPGTYTLYVGLYHLDAQDPAADTRLRTSDGLDAWPLAEVVVP